MRSSLVQAFYESLRAQISLLEVKHLIPGEMLIPPLILFKPV